MRIFYRPFFFFLPVALTAMQLPSVQAQSIPLAGFPFPAQSEGAVHSGVGSGVGVSAEGASSGGSAGAAAAAAAGVVGGGGGGAGVLDAHPTHTRDSAKRSHGLRRCEDIDLSGEVEVPAPLAIAVPSGALAGPAPACPRNGARPSSLVGDSLGAGATAPEVDGQQLSPAHLHSALADVAFRAATLLLNDVPVLIRGRPAGARWLIVPRGADGAPIAAFVSRASGFARAT
jgi:hypothetical protein